jgi:hypothetical protein
LIDTPGQQEGDTQDYAHRAEMIIRIQQIGSINAIFIVMNGAECRIDDAT